MLEAGPAQLRDWMRRRGFTQADAARYFGWDDPFLSKIVNGAHRPGLMIALKIEEYTGIPVEAWASRQDESADDDSVGAGKRRVAK